MSEVSQDSVVTHVEVCDPDAPYGRKADGTPRKPGPWNGTAGPASRPGSPRSRPDTIKQIARKIVDDPEYRRLLAIRLQVGEAPHMETLLWHYAYGKPKESVEVTHVESFEGLTTEELRERTEVVARAIALLPSSSESEPAA